MSDHEQPFTIELCGVEHEVIVCFDIDEFSTPDDWETGGGSGAEVSINKVYYLDDVKQQRCIMSVLEGLRDLELRTHTQGLRLKYLGHTWSHYIRVLDHDCGFKVLHGIRMWNGFHPAFIQFNGNRTIMDRLTMDVIEWVHENESDLLSDDGY